MDSRLDVNALGLTSTLISKLFDSLSGSLDATLSGLMNQEGYGSGDNRLGYIVGGSGVGGSSTNIVGIGSVSSGGSSGNLLLSSHASIKVSKSNTLIRKLASSGKIINLDQQNDNEWTNFARNFWFYYPSLMLISESSKYCKESAIKLVLEFLPKHVQHLQSSSASASPVNTTTFSSMLQQQEKSGSIGRSSAVYASGSFVTTSNSPTSPSPSSPSTSISSAGSSLITVLTSGTNSQTKLFSFEMFLSSISCYHQQSLQTPTQTLLQTSQSSSSNTDLLKYLDLIESTVEIVVADIITHILGKFDFHSPQNNQTISPALINRLRDLAFFYFKPTNARSLNFSTWISLRLSISDQWSLILGQLSRISLNPISTYLTKIVISNPPLDELLPLFKGIRWTSLNLTDSEKINEAEKLIVQMLMWIEGNKKNVLRLAQLEALDGMLLSMNDFTMASGIVEKMKSVYKRAEKLLKSDDFEERSLKLMCTILTRGPISTFEEEYESVMKRLWKTLPIQKKRDFSLECILRLLQGRFVPPRKITGLQAHLSSITESVNSNNGGVGLSMAAQLQQRMDRVYENSGSYLYAGLALNSGKMIPRLQDIIQFLFGKKQNIPKIIECIDLLSAITVHVAVHSLKLLTDTILPLLFSNSSPLYHVVALRSLSILLDPTGVFWNTAQSANSRISSATSTSISSVPSSIGFDTNNNQGARKDLSLSFETFLVKSFKYCEEQSSSGGEVPLSQDPLIISTQFEPTISLYTLISDTSSQHHHRFESETTVEAIKRWYEVCTKTPEQREKEFFEQSRMMSVSLMTKIFHWENSNQLPGPQCEPYPMKKKTIKKKTINVELLELFKETIRCTTILPKNFIVHNSLHKLVLHEEEEIAVAASHAIQVIMCDHPEYRTTLVQGYTSLILGYVGKDHVSLTTLLSQLLGLIDLWNERSFIESRHASVPLDSSFYPPKMLETEIEAIGLVHLCSPNPQTRMIALQLIRSISGIRNTETKHSLIANVLHSSWRTIIQRARHQLLLDNAFGIDKDIKLNPNDELPSAEEVASCNHDRLWGFVLSEIGRICVEHDCVKTLSKARGMLLNIIGNMPQIPTEQTTDEQKRHASYTLRYLWINCHSLLFSTSGIPSTYPLKPTPQELQDPMIDDMIKFEHNLQSKIITYLPTFWANLLSDVAWIREKLSFLCGLLHWRFIPTLIDSLNEWWTNNKQNKKLSRVRVDLSNIFRRISQHKDFPRALFESQDLVQVFVQFIQQIDPIFGDPTKLPSIHNENYFNDNAVVVYNFCNSLFTPTLSCLNGPIRKSLVSNIKSIPWTIGERYKTFKAILQWSGHPRVSQARMHLEGIEINKKLSKAKDSTARDEEKERIETALRKIRACSRLAAESILKLGTLFEEGKLQQEVLEWVVDSEHKGNRILRWVLSYHFDEAYSYFLNKCYSDNPAESVLYLHSIYDQYLPIPPVNPPTLGITQDIYQYYFDKALEEKDQEDLEDEPLTSTDKAFSRKLIDIGATLLFLSCLNLLHAAFLARIRSFDLITRLAPCAFGLSTLVEEEDVTVRSALLPKRQAFSSRNTPTNKLNAIEVSSIVSQSCSAWTERLFEEAFSRFPGLNSNNKKWTIQFLLPWCNNISLSEGENRLQRFTPVGFLKSFFSVFTEPLTNINQSSEMMPELIDLWLNLARKEPQNLTVIINFLVKKGITSKESMPICKILILHIYRMNPINTLEPLIYQLSYSGVVTGDKKAAMMIQIDSTNDLNDDKKSSKQHSTKIREACVLIITDLISENMGPIMPHVHILFNYSILRIDSAESASLTKMINVLLSALRNNLSAQIYKETSETESSEEDREKKQYRMILKSIDTILTSLRLPTFQIKFNFNGQKEKELEANEPIDTLNTAVVSIYSKRKSSFLVQGSSYLKKAPLTSSSIAGSKDSVIEHRNEMIKWCNGYIYVDELISVLCKYFEALMPSTIDKWEQESLYWIKNYKDPRISIKACQVYRSIIHCQQLLPSNLNNISKTQTLRRQKTRWASSVEHLVLLLQEWSEDLDHCVANLTKYPAAATVTSSMIMGATMSGLDTSTSKKIQFEQGLAAFNRTLCVEILLALKQIVESKNIDESSISLIFWSSISFLVPTHRFYEPLYETALSITSLLVMEQKIFKEIHSAITMDILQRGCKEIQVTRGIQYHLFKGLLYPKSEETCSQLIMAFFTTSSEFDPIVDANGSPQRYLLPLLALTPWLHNRILTSKSSIIYKEQKVAADKVAIALSEALLTTNNQIPSNQQLSAIFKRFSQGEYNSNPDQFLRSVIDLIRPVCIPKYSIECSDLIGNLLEYSQSLSTSILKATKWLIEDAPLQVIPLFKNIIRVGCECGSSSPVAGELIHQVVSIMKTNVINVGNLPPLLPPLDKTPSDIIKQLHVTRADHSKSNSGGSGQTNNQNSNQLLESKKRGHRRNKSPITDHPSLKEKAINEKKSQPVSPPKFSNVFNQQQQQQQQKQPEPQQHTNQQQQHQQQQINNSMGGDDEYDFEFDEEDEEEIENLNHIIDDPLTMSMQKSIWRTSDEYNVYLDIDENDFDGLEDLKEGLDGLDTSSLLNKLNSTSGYSSSIKSKDHEPNQTKSRSSSSSSAGGGTTTTTTSTAAKRRPSQSTSTSSPVKQSQQPVAPNTPTKDNPLLATQSSDGIESLRALLAGSTSGKRNSDSIQIDQLLSNLKNFDHNDESFANLESEIDKISSESPQSSYFLGKSGNSSGGGSSLNSLSFSFTQPSLVSTPRPTTGSTNPSVVGIKDILSDSKKRRAFLDFLKKQHYQKAVNDVCFVEVVNDFKADVEGSGEIGGDGLLFLMRHIVEGFVNENAKHSISISEKVREEVVKSYQDFISNGNNIDPHIFDIALEMVMKALEEKQILNAFLSSTKLE
eukprot:gene442-559_t